MRLYLINPSNPLVSIVKIRESRRNRYRVWDQMKVGGRIALDAFPGDWKYYTLKSCIERA